MSKQEVLRVCGLTADEICECLSDCAGRGVEFAVEEWCLDAKITMTEEESSLESVRAYVYNALADNIYSADDIQLPVLASQLLKINDKTLAVAESITGGEISSMLASVPGISSHFYEGIVSYNIGSKINRLNVRKNTLASHGAISRETAYEMVQGLVVPPVNIGLATTGLAGPNADENKPVGLVYIGVGAGDFITVFEKNLTGNRNTIRKATANLALFYLIRYLKGDILRL